MKNGKDMQIANDLFAIVPTIEADAQEVDEKKKTIPRENAWKQALRISTSTFTRYLTRSPYGGTRSSLRGDLDLQRKIIFLLQTIRDLNNHGNNISVSWNGKSSELISSGPVLWRSYHALIRCLNLYAELKDKDPKKADQALSFAAAHAPALGSRTRGHINLEGKISISSFILWQMKSNVLASRLASAPVLKK